MSDNTGNLAHDVVQRVTERARDIAKQIASTIGEPVDASKLSRAKVVELWNLPNPQADPMQIEQLIAQGHHGQAVDMAYPWRNKLIGKGDPQKLVDRAAMFARWASGQENSSAATE